MSSKESEVQRESDMTVAQLFVVVTALSPAVTPTVLRHRSDAIEDALQDVTDEDERIQAACFFLMKTMRFTPEEMRAAS